MAPVKVRPGRAGIVVFSMRRERTRRGISARPALFKIFAVRVSAVKYPIELAETSSPRSEATPEGISLLSLE